MRAARSRVDTVRPYSACFSLIGSTRACTGASHVGKAPAKCSMRIADEALVGAEDRAVDRHRPLGLAVGVDVLAAAKRSGSMVRSTWMVAICQCRPSASSTSMSIFGP